MSQFQLSKFAAEDIRGIRQFTRETFGQKQSVKLRERLLATFRSLAEAPLSGQVREEYDPPGKSFRYRPLLGAFVIVYEPMEEDIRVARVLHGARNLVAELELDAGGEGST